MPVDPIAAPAERSVPDPGDLLGECAAEMAEGLFQDPDAFKILVLRFDGSTSKDREFGQKVAGTLRTSLERYLEEEAATDDGRRAGVQPGQFEVRPVGCSVPSHASARGIGVAWGADLVLWGRASCGLASTSECRTVTLTNSAVEAGRDVNIGVVPFQGDYVPSATLIRGLPLQVHAEEGTRVTGSESSTMVEWDFPRVATSRPVALMHLMVGMEAFRRPDYVAAAAYLERAEADLGASEEAAQRLLSAMTTAYFHAGMPERAVERAQTLLARCQDEPRCQGAALTSLGLVWSALGEKQRALEFYEQALPLLRKVGDVGGEAATLNNIGLVWSDLGEKQRALESVSYTHLTLPTNREV